MFEVPQITFISSQDFGFFRFRTLTFKLSIATHYK